jgi:hypothetical protein
MGMFGYEVSLQWGQILIAHQAQRFSCLER